MPAHLFLFCIESVKDLRLTVLGFLGLNLLAALIAALTLLIRKALHDDMPPHLLYTKHHLLRFAALSALFFFLQPYLAIPLCLLWYLFAHKLFEADRNLISLWSYPIKQSPKDRHKNAALIEIAAQVQASLPQNASWGAILRSYNEQRKTAAQLPPTACLNKEKGWQPFFTFPFLQTVFFASLVCIVKLVLTLLSSQALWIDTARGIPLLFLVFNAILTATVIFGGLVCGILILDQYLHSVNNHSERLVILLILLYILVIILFLNHIFGWVTAS